tara:strand:+ start:2480 stop:4012 length:1533 start_codon:yes stop_codon:yes gene_type:complete
VEAINPEVIPSNVKLNVTNLKSIFTGGDGGGSAIVKKSGGGLGSLRGGSIIPSPSGALTTENLQQTETQDENIFDIIAKIEKKISINSFKITKLKDILKVSRNNRAQGSDIDEISLAIQSISSVLAKDFAFRIDQGQQENDNLRTKLEKEGRKEEEQKLEGKRKSLFTGIKETTKKLLQPAVGLFDKIKEFLLTIFAGQLVTGAFSWLSDEANRKKLEKVFDWVVNNFKWLVGGVVLVGVALAIRKIMKIVKAIRGVIKVIRNAFRLAKSIFKYGPKLGKAITRLSIAVGGKKAGKIAAKITGTTSKNIGKKVIAKTGKKIAAKTLTKTAGKAGAKSLLKKIPFVGLGLGAVFAIDRMRKGDWGGALLELGSGAASMIPGVGTAVSLAADAALVAKDVNDASNMEARETGGSVSKDKSYLVGERGAEIFKPNTAGTIIPNKQTEDIVSKLGPVGEGTTEIVQMDLGTEKDKMPEQPPLSLGITNIMEDINSVNVLNPYMNKIKEKYKIKV